MTVANEPEFGDCWKSIAPCFESECDERCLIAHNAPFDIGVLTACLNYHHIPVPELRVLLYPVGGPTCVAGSSQLWAQAARVLVGHRVSTSRRVRRFDRLCIDPLGRRENGRGDLDEAIGRKACDWSRRGRRVGIPWCDTGKVTGQIGRQVAAGLCQKRGLTLSGKSKKQQKATRPQRVRPLF
jgi:hypothetical protein